MGILRPSGDFDRDYKQDMSVIRKRWQWLAIGLALAATFTAPLWGNAYIDLSRMSLTKGSGYKVGDEWLVNIAKSYERQGIPTYVDRHPERIPTNFPLGDDVILYFGWYARNASLLLRFFGPLEMVSTLAVIIAAAVSTYAGAPSSAPLVIASACALGVLLSFPLYFRAANLSFAAGTIGAEHVSAELGRWSTWHWCRTVVALVAFGAALLVADLASAFARRAGRVPATVVALALLVFLSERTLARLPTWESNLGLFEYEIARDPAYREGWFLVAVEHYERGRLREANHALTTLLTDGPEFAGTASYWNPLSVSELACTLHLALREYNKVLELERELERRHPSVLRAAPLKTCIGQAHIALGEPAIGLAAFEAVERELGPDTPPGLYLKIARAHLLLGQTEATRAWIARALASVGPDYALRAKIVRFEKSLPPQPGEQVDRP